MNEKALTDEVHGFISKADIATQLAVMKSVKELIVSDLTAMIETKNKESDVLQKYLGEFQKL